MRTLALLAFFCGCNGDDAVSANDESSIQGGRADKGDPAVGLVWFSGGGYCSGSLIAPDVVLTAGHCVADRIDGFYTGAGKQVGETGAKPVAGFLRHAVDAQLAHPSYSSYGGCPNETFDVGLIHLTKPIAGVKPLTRAAALPARSSKSCRIVGYGVHDDASGESFEQKRAASVSLGDSGSTWVEVVWKTGISDHGDSGGPLLCGDKIVAVTSCGISDEGTAFYARVDDIGKWIDSTIAKWK